MSLSNNIIKLLKEDENKVVDLQDYKRKNIGKRLSNQYNLLCTIGSFTNIIDEINNMNNTTISVLLKDTSLIDKQIKDDYINDLVSIKEELATLYNDVIDSLGGNDEN